MFRVFEVMLVRLLWLKVIEDKSPELCPLFFKVDLAPYILEILRRDDGASPGLVMGVAMD